MARRTAEYRGAGRDEGKTFIITEMSALAGERWARQALMALIATGMEFPEDIPTGSDVQDMNSAPAAELARLGFTALGKAEPARVEPLMQEMLQYVSLHHGDPALIRKLNLQTDEDIEEMGTVINLRRHFLVLHLGFLAAARAQIMAQESAAPLKNA